MKIDRKSIFFMVPISLNRTGRFELFKKEPPRRIRDSRTWFREGTNAQNGIKKTEKRMPTQLDFSLSGPAACCVSDR
jgi:hypothetical protein